MGKAKEHTKATGKKRAEDAGVKKKHGAAKRPPGRQKPPLSSAAIRKFRDLLIDHKERITRDVATLRETHLHSSQRDATGDLSGYSLHMADMGTDTYDREFGLAMATTEGNIVYLIDLALRRIEEKSYGLCETCGKPIKVERLKAVPWARLCIACKKAEETEGGNPAWQPS
jgi:RNA polymerase-binding protein DksA